MMHGECKSPGGKLVAVDLNLDERAELNEVRVHGDFFLHPESATRSTLDAIGLALKGRPKDLDIPALAAHVRAAIPFGVELLGTTPEAIALAVRRAITGPDDAEAPSLAERIGKFTASELDQFTESWKVFGWRLIPEVPRSPAMNVALDEVLSNQVASKQSPPILRFWRWSSPAIIIGRTQSVLNEVDEAAATSRGITVVRRMTGGGAMFLQPHGAITYSLYLPETAITGLSIRASYEVCESWVIDGLRLLGVDAHHVPINDIACSEGKIGGAAQARRAGVVLHHTTMAYDMDPGEMVQVLRIGREKLKDKATASAAKRVSPLVRQTGLSREAIVSHLFQHFQNRFGGTLSEVSPSELQEAERLVETKYAHPDWTREFE
ncbi:MAG: lipoate--protein ligase family protein [Fimbriiglobus sp.]